jgi:transposase
MELKEKQYQRIADLLPVQRGNVKIPNHTLLSALIYRLENGCKWRALPKTFGNWHTIYMRLDRWSRNGVLERVYTALAAEGLLKMGVCALDSTAIKVHPDAHGAPKKTAPKR